MSEEILEEVDDLSQPAVDGDMVHWMNRRPLRLGAAGISITAGASFSLGVVAAVGVLAMIKWLGPERVVVVPARRRFRF